MAQTFFYFFKVFAELGSRQTSSLPSAGLSANLSKKYYFQTSSTAILFHYFLKKSLPSDALGKGV